MKILSVDLGASKCEINLGIYNDYLKIHKIGDFNNYLDNNEHGYIWNINKIINYIKYYIEKTLKKFGEVDYFVICSWGLDYIMFDDGDSIMYPCYSYRNSRTQEHYEIDNPLHYEKGISNAQNLTFYQLKSESLNRLKKCKFILSIADSINFILCKEKYWNESIASTTGLFDIEKKNFDLKILDYLGIREKIPTISHYGQIIGKYNGIKIINGLSHDTASSIYSLKIKNNSEAYIICGTWCIVGVVNDEIQKNDIGYFTNESSYKKTRFLKNVIGLWLIQKLSKERNMTYEELDKYAGKYNDNIEPLVLKDFQSFDYKKNIEKILYENCKKQNKEYKNNIGFLVKLIYISLIHEFKKSMIELESIKNIKIQKINLLGGGCKSKVFMDLISKNFNIPIKINYNLNSSIGNIFFIKDIISNK